MADTLVAAGGLELHFARDGSARVAFGGGDWLGPLGLLVEHGGRRFRGGALSPGDGAAPEAAGAAKALAPQREAFAGEDALGRHQGVTLSWSPLPFALRTSVRAYADAPLVVFRIEAPAALGGLATGAFERTSVAWPAFVPGARAAGGVPEGTRSGGHQYTEFALPVIGDAGASGLRLAAQRPAVIEPLFFLAPDGRTLMLAPLGAFHEQVIALDLDAAGATRGVRCGWHGDLEEVPAGFATELALWAADGPRAALDAWGAQLQRRYGTRRPSRYADVGVGKLSYWTDNGAFYYYRTEPGCDYTATLERVVKELGAAQVPIASLQLDSWFYPHETLRGVSPEGAPVVPPTGMLRWEPREDLFPDGFRDLPQRLGGLPLTLHSRHFSKDSPYFEAHPAWRDERHGHPADPAFFRLFMEQAALWGAVSYEQDWLVESFLGVRGLRAAPGRARAWQQGMDRAAGERGLTLQWCMASPADFFESVTLRNVTSIRTSGDYRYMFHNGFNWVWFLQTNALARALGLHPYKDVFLSHGDTGFGPGEPYAEVESLLASLSAGPVGIGDRVGFTQRELVMRSCREDGVLVKPDVPLAALDRCFRENAFLEHAPLVGECHSAHPAGRWIYLASFHASRVRDPLRFRVALADLGARRPAGPVVAYDWRRGSFERVEPGGGFDLALDFQEFDLRVLCPLLPGGLALFGDVSKWACAGDRRIAGIRSTGDGLAFEVFGAPGQPIEVQGFAAARPRGAELWLPGGRRALAEIAPAAAGEGWSWEPDGRLRLRVAPGPMGHARVSIAGGGAAA